MTDWRRLHGRWVAMLGDEELGVIDVGQPDQPWMHGTFRPGPAFSEAAPLFARELALLNADVEDWDAWEEAYGALEAHGLGLLRPDGMPVAEVLLHIDGDNAWFRWSDEPFESG